MKSDELSALVQAQTVESYQLIPDGKRLVAVTPFVHLDGDPVEVFVEQRGEQLVITDLGQTVARLYRDRVPLNTAWREQAMRTIKATFEVESDDGALVAYAQPSALLSRISAFVSAVLMISSLTFRERKEQVSSRFVDEVYHFVDEHTQGRRSEIARGWTLGDVDRKGAYIADVAVTFNGSRRLIFAITSEERCATAALSCYFWRFRYNLPFKSLAVFESYTAIPPRQSERVIGAADVVAPSLQADQDKIRHFLSTNGDVR